MTLRLIIICLLTLASGFVVFAQAILTNSDVIDLVKSGIGPEIVIAKIKASNSSFDTSTAALLKLGEAKVPESVVVAMIEKESQQAEKNKVKTANNEDSLSKIPEEGTLKDLAGLKKYYVSTSIPKSRERIEKEMTKAGFEFADKAEDAEFIIAYDEREEYVIGSPRMKQIGTFLVGIPISERNIPIRRRNVYLIRKDRFLITSADPAQAAAQQFIKELRRALEK